MKHFSLILCLCIFLSGCGTVKKMAASYSSESKEKTTEEIAYDSSRLIDTTKVNGKVVSIVKVDFYGDTPTITKPDTVGEKPPIAPPVDTPKNTIEAGGTKITGNIKSAEIINISNQTEEKGISATTENFSEEIITDTSQTVESVEEVTPVKDPRRFIWLAILIAVALVALLIVYNKFIKPLGLGGKINVIFSKLSGLFKIKS